MATDRFPSPFDIPTPAGAEGWESMYDWYHLFGPERRAQDEERFWFADRLHHPDVLEEAAKYALLSMDSTIQTMVRIAEMSGESEITPITSPPAASAASAQPAAWVRQTARRRPDLVTAWSRELRGLTGERRGDTVAVVLSAPDLQGCSQTSSVSALLLNHSASPRLLAIGSACVDRQALRGLRLRPITRRLLTGSR